MCDGGQRSRQNLQAGHSLSESFSPSSACSQVPHRQHPSRRSRSSMSTKSKAAGPGVWTHEVSTSTVRKMQQQSGTQIPFQGGIRASLTGNSSQKHLGKSELWYKVRVFLDLRFRKTRMPASGIGAKCTNRVQEGLHTEKSPDLLRIFIFIYINQYDNSRL